MTTKKLAGEIYRVLVDFAGAPAHKGNWEQFEVWFNEPGLGEEYRFEGRLGFGGKFWKGRMEVSCYPEDENRERLKVIKKTNRVIRRIIKSQNKNQGAL